MFANIGRSGNESGSKRGKRLLMTVSFKTRAFETMAFNGDTCDDDVEKGVRRGRRLKISGTIKVVLGTLGEELLEIGPDSIHRKIANEEVDHLPFLEGDPHGDETRTCSLELADILVKTCKILKLDIGNMSTEVKLGGNINATIKGFESGPNVTGGGCFSARDNGGDDGGNAALNDVLDLRVLLPPFTIGLEGTSTSTSSDDGCRDFRKRRKRVVGAFDETPKALALQGTHDRLAPGGVISRAVEDGDVVEF